jgi:ribosomal protein S18 acetylase RimI-like enzyme
MVSAKQLEILDIRNFNARQLRPLLEQEAAAWEKRLRWDYKSSTELLLTYLDSHVLPGFVALDRGKVCGFTFCVYEGQKAVVGDAYAIPATNKTPPEITRVLLVHLLEVLIHAPNITRIESQLLLYDEGVNNSVFTNHGFSIYRRLFMECELKRPAKGLNGAASLAGSTDRRLRSEASEWGTRISAKMQVRQWEQKYYQASAELIHEAYLGNIDSTINDQYRTLHGSLRFLHNIVRFPGCGVFEETASWCLFDMETGKLTGLVLCSRVAPRVAHITQLCVAPKVRRAGMARGLMLHAMAHLLAVGYEAITLTVTEANEAAVRLYEELAFVTRHRFDAMVCEKTIGVGL